MLLEKKYNFVYITTNLITKQQYIGEHSTDDLNCQKSKNYLGSGKPYLSRAIKLYGIKNFKREILEFFSAKQEAFDAQAPLIIKYNTLSPNGYNLSSTGGIRVKNCFHPDKKMSGKTKKKISNSLRGKPLSLEHIANLKGKNLGRKLGPLSKERKEQIGLIWKGKKQSAEHIEKRRISNLGKTPSIETRQKMAKAKKGKPLSEDHKKNISNSGKGLKRTEETKERIRQSKLGNKNPMYKKLI